MTSRAPAAFPFTLAAALLALAVAVVTVVRWIDNGPLDGFVERLIAAVRVRAEQRVGANAAPRASDGWRRPTPRPPSKRLPG